MRWLLRRKTTLLASLLVVATAGAVHALPFAPTGSMATVRFVHTATLLANGTVLVAGGFNNSAPLASAEIYDPLAGTFSPAGSMATARYFHTATSLPGRGTVLVAGGFNNTAAGERRIYDSVSGTFSPVGNMTTARTITRPHGSTTARCW
jgi:hypothetical protein